MRFDCTWFFNILTVQISVILYGLRLHPSYNICSRWVLEENSTPVMMIFLGCHLKKLAILMYKRTMNEMGGQFLNINANLGSKNTTEIYNLLCLIALLMTAINCLHTVLLEIISALL